MKNTKLFTVKLSTSVQKSTNDGKKHQTKAILSIDYTTVATISTFNSWFSILMTVLKKNLNGMVLMNIFRSNLLQYSVIFTLVDPIDLKSKIIQNNVRFIVKTYIPICKKNAHKLHTRCVEHNFNYSID